MGGTVEDTALCCMSPSGRSGRFPALPLRLRSELALNEVEGAGSILPDSGGIIPIHAVALKR